MIFLVNFDNDSMSKNKDKKKQEYEVHLMKNLITHGEETFRKKFIIISANQL